MALNINGTTGISGVDGSVSAPALTGTDSNTGITFPSADTIKFSTGGVERMSITNSGVTGTGVSNGKILQVVFGETTSEVSDTSGNYVDSGVTATITPSSTSNKIMVIVSMQWFLIRDASETNGSFKLLRGSTAISTHEDAVHIEAGLTSQSRIISEGGYTIQRLDSPSTTSATTYKVQFKTNVTANNAKMHVNRGNAPSCITLMEVAA